MGLKCSPDFAQKEMECVLWDIDDYNIYLGDIGALFDDWEHDIDP